MSKARTLVAGAAGYAGALAADLVWRHPSLELVHATARSDVGARLNELYPQYEADVELTELDLESLDGVGAATWQASLDSAARRGLVVSYGNASGPVTGVALGQLAQKGSLSVTRPTLFDYYVTAEERRTGVERLWSMIREGKVRITVGGRYPLTEAADVHRALEARATSGSLLLIP